MKDLLRVALIIIVLATAVLAIATIVTTMIWVIIDPNTDNVLLALFGVFIITACTFLLLGVED